MAQRSTEIAPRERHGVTGRDALSSRNPFRMLERFAEQMDSVFDDFGLGRNWSGARFGRGPLGTPWHARSEMWAPDIDVSQHDNEFVVRADVPGMKKEDVSVDVTDNDITISGERRLEEETERGGVYRSERSYGTFFRTIPLPEGAIADQAKASFKDGVLEIRMPAPNQATRGRRLEIKDNVDPKK